MHLSNLDALFPDSSRLSVKAFYADWMYMPDASFWASVPDSQIARWRIRAGANTAHKWGGAILAGVSLGVSLGLTSLWMWTPQHADSAGHLVTPASLMNFSLDGLGIGLGFVGVLLGIFIVVMGLLLGPMSELWNTLFGCVDAGKIEGLLRYASRKDIDYFEKEHPTGPAREYLELVRKKRPVVQLDFKCMWRLEQQGAAAFPANGEIEEERSAERFEGASA